MRTTKQQAYKTALVAFVTALAMAAASSPFAVAQSLGTERIYVGANLPIVAGDGWPADTDVTVTVDDPSTVPSPVSTSSTAMWAA